MMTEAELFKKVKGSYLTLIHLSTKKSDMDNLMNLRLFASEQLIKELIVGCSWRERLVGLFLACTKDLKVFYHSMFFSLNDIRGICIIPLCAVIALCVNKGGCLYDLSMTSNLNKDLFDGELGFSLDKMHYYIGISTNNPEGNGRNYGQIFESHYMFYMKLHAAKGLSKTKLWEI